MKNLLAIAKHLLKDLDKQHLSARSYAELSHASSETTDTKLTDQLLHLRLRKDFRSQGVNFSDLLQQTATTQAVKKDLRLSPEQNDIFERLLNLERSQAYQPNWQSLHTTPHTARQIISVRAQLFPTTNRNPALAEPLLPKPKSS